MSSKEFQEVPPDTLVCQPQVRTSFDEQAIADMAQTILAVGVLQPIEVRREGDQLIITDGELRWRAAKKAGLKTVPIVIENRELSEADVLQRQLIANCQRQDLKPVENATAIDRLMRIAGLSAAEVANKVGKSNASISKSLAMLPLPASILQQIESGVIAPSAAYELAQIDDPEKQAEFAAQLVGGRLTRDGLSGARKAESRIVGNKATPPLSRVTAKLGQGRSITVAGTDLTLESFITSLEELLAKARKARPQGLELGTFLKMLKDQAKA